MGQKKIQNLLNKEGGVTLEELLAEDETVSETKNSNQNLITFLTKEENMERLIKFVIEDPSDPTNKNESYK